MDHQTAAALLSRMHEAQNAMYAGGDVGPVRALLTPDVRWHVPGDNAISGTYDGLEEVVEYFRHRRDLVSGSLRLHPRGLLVGDGQHIASLTDGSALVQGQEQHWSTVGLYRLAENRIAECWLLPLDPEAFDRAWSASAVSADPIAEGAPILIVTGPPGVGKTSVSRALARSYDRAVHLEADTFFRFIAAGYLSPWLPESHDQNSFVMGLVAETAAGYAGQGYRTIVEGILLPGWFLGPVVGRLRSAGHEASCVMLDAPLEVCQARLVGRADTDLPDAAVTAQLWEGFRDSQDVDCLALDTSALTAAAAAAVIAQRW